MRRASRRRIRRLMAVGEPVAIPQSLIDKLKPLGHPHFIKVAKPIAGDPKSGKNAVEHAWQDNPYEADDPSLRLWLGQGNSYGVTANGKDGLIIIDADTREAAEKIAALINTYTVQSGGGEWKRHFYVLSNATENGTVTIDKKNVANIQVESKYVVGVGCHHFTGGVYKVVNDAPLAFISKEALERIFGVNLTWAHQRRIEIGEQTEQETKEGVIPIKDLVDMSKMRYRGNGEYQGTHPIHDSSTGKNFNVNINTNEWYCFRCNSGGRALSWLAVKYGLIECSEAPLRRSDIKYLETLKLAKEKGFDVKVPNEELSPDVTEFFEKDDSGHNKFVPAYLADRLMKERHFVTRAKDKMIFCYDPSGIHKPDGDQVIALEVAKKLGKHASINRRREVCDLIQTKTTQDLPLLAKDLIAVQNGILNIYTRELKPFSPDFFVLNALPVTYDPNAKCTVYLVFLEQVVPPQADRDGLQEFLGYILSPSCVYSKAIMLIGVGANGKSRLLLAWSAMLGEKNISKISLQELSVDIYALADLFGKMANICTDLQNIGLKDGSIFMRLTDGEPVSAQEKFKGRFDFAPTCKLAYATNDPPKPPKETEAYFRRWLMVTFPNRFPADDPKTDPRILEKITTPEELSGMLNWALDGLDRLTKNNAFTNSKTTEDTRTQYAMISDPQKAFVEKRLTLPSFKDADATDHIEKRELYEAYLKFCEDNNLPSATMTMFGRRLPDCIPCAPGDMRKGGGHVRTWQGIRFKTEAEMAEDAEARE
jgi:P4 family phage/plasmid primase-like protien